MFGIKTADAVKEKKLSPKEAMAQDINTLAAGSELVYKLGPIYVKPFITVTVNPEHPAKGKKFMVFQEAAGDNGRPGGKRGKFWDTNNGKEIAGWILEREGASYRG